MMRSFAALLAALALVGCAGNGSPSAGTERVVVLGGAVAETVHALGAADVLVGRDASVLHPAELQTLPSVGYYRQISAEGVLSLAPTLVLADPASGPEGALRQIEAAGVRVVRLPGGGSPEGVEVLIRAVADALGGAERADSLVTAFRARLAEAAALRPARPPRVVFVLGQGGSPLSLSGRGTHADAFIRLAGAENAFGHVAVGYKPMSAEGFVEAAPEVVFMLEGTADAVGGPERFARRPEVAATAAGTPGRILVLPNHALAFGPGLGDAVLDFARRLRALEADPPLAVR